MTERPIMFSGEMIKAILEGRKTQTRRVCKDQTPKKYWYGKNLKMIPDGIETYTGWVKDIENMSMGIPSKCPYGKAGDRLWVRETYFKKARKVNGISYLYRADEPDAFKGLGKTLKWNPSIFMPRWASRITLEITNVRVERLQDISEEDAKREGIWGKDEPYQGVGDLPTDRFTRLWDSINGKKYPWDSNPWVWVIGFRRII